MHGVRRSQKNSYLLWTGGPYLSYFHGYAKEEDKGQQFGERDLIYFEEQQFYYPTAGLKLEFPLSRDGLS